MDSTQHHSRRQLNQNRRARHAGAAKVVFGLEGFDGEVISAFSDVGRNGFHGLGEGAYYVGKELYRKQIVEKLGFEPYPGTLNLKLSSDYDIKTRMELDAYPAIEVKGFQNEDRSFGLVKCYPVMIGNEVKGALVTALRSHYDASVLEIIAPVCLRKALCLKDGHKVKVEVYTQPS